MKRFAGILMVLVILVVGWAVAVMANAVTVYNPSGSLVGNYESIQAGVNACPVDGTVSVSAGTYNEAVYINKRIALVGNGTPTITAAGTGVSTTVALDGNGASISGFRITGATQDGVVCCNHSAANIITNNMIFGNKFDGIHCEVAPSIIIANNTIFGNGYAGIDCYSSSASIFNNIISKNGSWGGICCRDSSLIINYNCVWGNNGGNYNRCFAGPNDISLDPQFISQSDCHLQSSSPCINSGSNTAQNTTTMDIDGNPRIVNGTIDIGAYEYQDILSPTTALFSDDFNDNNIDMSKWTYSRYRVAEESNIMKAETTVTDQAGILYSKWIDINPEEVLTITRRVNVHYANQYFTGGFRIQLDGTPEFLFGVSYDHYNYLGGGEVPREGFFLTRNGEWFAHRAPDQEISEAITGVWDTWFNEKMVYHPTTGMLEYFINEETLMPTVIGTKEDEN